MNFNAIVSLLGCVLTGVAVGLHFGILDGVAAGCAVYALMPYRVPGR